MINKSAFEKEKHYPILGCIIHLHTTRDLCQSCAYTIGNELQLLASKNEDSQLFILKKQIQEGFNKFANKELNKKEINTDPEKPPFITFMFSCRKLMPERDINSIRPCGVYNEHTYESFCLENQKQSTNHSIDKSLVTNHQSSSNEDEKDEEKNDDAVTTNQSSDEKFSLSEATHVSLNAVLATGGWFLQSMV
ncbi:MAG: hypothetical protein AAF380_00990 [Bacteroidota bacterium]